MMRIKGRGLDGMFAPPERVRRMEITLHPGDVVTVSLADSESEVVRLIYDDGAFRVSARLPDATGRDGVVYDTEEPPDESWPVSHGTVGPPKKFPDRPSVKTFEVEGERFNLVRECPTGRAGHPDWCVELGWLHDLPGGGFPEPQVLVRLKHADLLEDPAVLTARVVDEAVEKAKAYLKQRAETAVSGLAALPARKVGREMTSRELLGTYLEEFPREPEGEK